MSAPLKKKGERRVFGVGHKAPSTKVYAFENKVMLWKCPYYVLWTSILRRCYSEVYLLKNPSYRGCVVEEVWHTFENFKSWVLARKKYLLSPYQDERVGAAIKTICKNILQDLAEGNLTHKTLRK